MTWRIKQLLKLLQLNIYFQLNARCNDLQLFCRETLETQNKHLHNYFSILLETISLTSLQNIKECKHVDLSPQCIEINRSSLFFRAITVSPIMHCLISTFINRTGYPSHVRPWDTPSKCLQGFPQQQHLRSSPYLSKQPVYGVFAPAVFFSAHLERKILGAVQTQTIRSGSPECAGGPAREWGRDGKLHLSLWEVPQPGGPLESDGAVARGLGGLGKGLDADHVVL